MFGRSATSFDKLMEKATSQLLLEPDWNINLQICDAVRQEDVTSKAAVAAVKKKIVNDNPHVAKLALVLLESMVKNCGAPIQQEVATKEMMDFMREQILKRPDVVKSKLLELIQVWSHAFRSQPAYKIVEDTYKVMKHEGMQFPVMKEADAMFAAEKAPEWKDGESCHRCKDKFGTFNRRHHCRCCGDIFCNKCSSKNSIIPQFGIEREVRVCDACYEKLNTGVPGREDELLPTEYLASSLAKQPQNPPVKSEREIQQQEEEELQLALALSQSEAEAKAKEREKNRSRTTHSTVDGPPASLSAAQPNKFSSVPAIDTTDMDPELARYLDRNYWQQRREENKQGMQQPSAPMAQVESATGAPASRATVEVAAVIPEVEQNGYTSGEEDEQFMDALEKSMEIFVNRMKSDSLRGRSIGGDSSVQTLFMTLSAMHTELVKNMQKLDDNRVYCESLQDRLAELKDAREALEVLREEHKEKRRREQEELERQRQLQMAHKLDILRQKKQEYLEHQRQLALQKMQEQELEMQMRIEQQKQMQQMRQMYNNPYMQSVYNSMAQTYTGQPGSEESSPRHNAHYPNTVQSSVYNTPYQQQQTSGYLPQQPGYTLPGQAAPYQQQQHPSAVNSQQGPQPTVGSNNAYYGGYQNQPSYQVPPQTVNNYQSQPQTAVNYQGQGQPVGAYQGQPQTTVSYQNQPAPSTSYQGQPQTAGYAGQQGFQNVYQTQPAETYQQNSSGYPNQMTSDYQYQQGYQGGNISQPLYSSQMPGTIQQHSQEMLSQYPPGQGPPLTDAQLISFD